MNSELIRLKGVVKKFKNNVVLDGVDLSIPENQITGIIGASGEGKSTILKLMIGYYKPNQGEVLYLKRSVFNDVHHVQKTFGFATEDGSFYGNLTVKENLHHFGYLYNMKRAEVHERARELLTFVGLENAENTRAKYLSVGMKKRLDFACSLMHMPEVLIMDEPTADLDPLLRKQILHLIRTIKEQGTTIVLTTQLLEEVDSLCDKVAILYDKKIVEEGHPGKIKAKYNAKNLNEVFEKIFSKKKNVSEKKITSRVSGEDEALEQLEHERDELKEAIAQERVRETFKQKPKDATKSFTPPKPSDDISKNNSAKKFYGGGA